MKISFLLFFTCCAGDMVAQNAQQEINDQVWTPFIQTFNNYDTDGFMALHSKDVVRSPRDSKAVWNWNEYYQREKKGDAEEKTSGVKRDLTLRFTERIAGDDLAVDVGIYKTTITRSDGKIQSFYGRFHVVLRKENNTWKILVDTDSSEGQTINEQHFLKAQSMK
jgi:ketosteroid isomerase-like protein